MKRIASRCLILLLALSLCYCGQKGGLTRPEQNTFAAGSK